MSSPITLLLRREHPDFFTTTEVAAIIGRSKETVARWRKLGYLEPSEYTMTGKTVVWLYSEKDLAMAKEIAKSRAIGKKE